MELDDVTPDMVIEAARRIQKRKGAFTAKDIWYELELDTRFSRNPYGDARKISNLLQHGKGIRDRIVKKKQENVSEAVRYTVKEEKWMMK